MDRGAWWAAIYGVAQSRTQLKQLSSLFIMCLPLWFNTYSKTEMSSFPYVFLERISRLVRNSELYLHLHYPWTTLFSNQLLFPL